MARAQDDLARLCQSSGTLTVGTWASFQVSRPGSTVGGELRVATIATEQRADTSLYWLEVTYRSKKKDSHPVTFQFLIPGLPGDPTSVRALILKTGNWPATRLGAPALNPIAHHIRRDNPELGTLTSCLAGDVVGWEPTTVPAGAFHALHVKSADREEWLLDSIPFGVVRLKSAQSDLVLTGHGAGAQSSITETPRQFPRWLSEMAMSLESGEALGSRDATQRERLGQLVCDSLRHAQLIRVDSEPYLSPEAALFLWTADSLPIEERPRLLTGGKGPKYPKQLVKHGVEGRVVIQGVVDTSGRIEEGTPVVVSSNASALESSALEFIERARFAPGRLCAQPVRVLIQVPIDYKVKSR